MNKRAFLAFLLIISLFLSGCSSYSSDYVAKTEEEFNEKINKLEEKCSLLDNSLLELNYALNDIYENFIPIRAYYSEHDSDFSEIDALSGIDKITEIYNNLGQ
jgi:hypothetical protein